MDEDKIIKLRKKLFDRLRKLNKVTSEEKLKELENLIKQKSKDKGIPSGNFCFTGLEITIDQLMEVYNDISNRTNCPFKYVKEDKGRTKSSSKKK